METANLFVFVGHGLGETPVAGSLVIVEDSGRPGLLSMYDAIAHVLRNSNIGVILSGCETAWDPDASSGGTTSISAALLRAGAKFVLGTQWWVADRVAPVVTEAFTAALLAGDPPERAFVIAAKAGSEAQIDPLLWGTFCLWLGQGQS